MGSEKKAGRHRYHAWTGNVLAHSFIFFSFLVFQDCKEAHAYLRISPTELMGALAHRIALDVWLFSGPRETHSFSN